MNSRVSMVAASLVALAGASVANAQWTTQTINDGNARFSLNSMPTLNTSGGSTPTADLRPNNTILTTAGDNLFTAWWWVRDGSDTRERCIAVAAGQQAAVVKTSTANSVTYSNIQIATTGAISNIRFAMTFAVLDLDGAGTAACRVAMTLTATNIGTSTVTGMTFQNYIDPFLGGADAGDQCLAGNHGVAGGNRFMTYTDAGFPGSNLTHVGIAANAYTGGSFSLVGSQMGDATVDNFTDNNGALVAGDQSSVMQWNFGDLAAGASVSATAFAVMVPTPGAAALLGLGGLMASRRRRA